MMVVLKWSVPVAEFQGETQMERMIRAQDAIEQVQHEVLDRLEQIVGDRDGAGDLGVSAQFMEFYDLPDGGHGRETLRARFLISVEHDDLHLLQAVIAALGGEIAR